MIPCKRKRKMSKRKLLGSSTLINSNIFKILAVIMVIALAMSTKIVAQFISEKQIIKAPYGDIQRTSEDILLLAVGALLFLISGFIIIPVFKIALMVTAAWLVIKSGMRILETFGIIKKKG